MSDMLIVNRPFKLDSGHAYENGYNYSYRIDGGEVAFSKSIPSKQSEWPRRHGMGKGPAMTKHF